jgi:hypothetical protein
LKIRMRVAMSGTHNGVPYPPLGVDTDVDDNFGAQLCRKGLALPVAQRPGDNVETAVAPTGELRRAAAQRKQREETP